MGNNEMDDDENDSDDENDKAKRKACKVNLLQKVLEEPVCVDILGLI